MFLQSCFIRKNTSKLRESLYVLGYNVDEISLYPKCIATSNVNSKAVGISEDRFDDNNPHRTWNCNGRIDCGTNEELFLAIAALRDDSDINQLFKNNECDEFIKCDYDEFHLFTFNPLDALDNNDLSVYYHKATVKELIEYFKDKDNEPKDI